MEVEPLLDAVPQGSPFLADKAYDSDVIRARIESQGIFGNVLAKRCRTRGFAFNLFLYRYRNLIE